jgi:hypothetical protein
LAGIDLGLDSPRCIAKLESGADAEIAIAELVQYLHALDLDRCLVCGQKDSTIVNKVGKRSLTTVSERLCSPGSLRISAV